MDPLDEMVARICGSMDRIGAGLLREADELHALRIEAGKALEAQTEALSAISDALGEAQ